MQTRLKSVPHRKSCIRMNLQTTFNLLAIFKLSDAHVASLPAFFGWVAKRMNTRNTLRDKIQT